MVVTTLALQQKALTDQWRFKQQGPWVCPKVLHAASEIKLCPAEESFESYLQSVLHISS